MDRTRLIGLNWSALRREADAYAESAGPSAFDLATQWYGDEAWEARYFAISVLGRLCPHA